MPEKLEQGATWGLPFGSPCLRRRCCRAGRRSSWRRTRREPAFVDFSNQKQLCFRAKRRLMRRGTHFLWAAAAAQVFQVKLDVTTTDKRGCTILLIRLAATG